MTDAPTNEELADFIFGLRDAQSWSAETVARIEQAARRLRGSDTAYPDAEMAREIVVAQPPADTLKQRLRDQARDLQYALDQGASYIGDPVGRLREAADRIDELEADVARRGKDK